MTNKQRAYHETQFSCAYCGNPNNLTIDHIEGRDHEHWKKYDNLIVLCRACHDDKDYHGTIDKYEIIGLKRGLIFKTLGDARLFLLHAIEHRGIKCSPYKVRILLELGLIRFSGRTKGGMHAYVPTREGKRFYEKWIAWYPSPVQNASFSV